MEKTKTWMIYLHGKALEKNSDAKSILKGVRFKLITEVFRKSSCNTLLTVISEFGFEDAEIESLKLQTLTPQDWTIKFIDILLNRHNLAECLNILCNLHKHKLSNYQELIVDLFKSLPHVEVKEVELHCDRDGKAEQYVMFQGNKVKLEELMNEITTPIDKKIRDELASGNVPIVVNKQVPDKLQYYVHRTVTTRNRLKVDVLKHDCKDVFVIEGMNRHQLTSLVRDSESTDVSGNQLKKLTVQFILLQHKHDYYKIRKLGNAQSLSVHRIKYNDKKLELVEFSGSATNLQKYIDNSQVSFFEDELAFSTQKVVIITDSPGMGKTSLLANIAHQIKVDDDRTFIRFIVLKEFVQALSKTKINVESIVKTIAKQSSEFEFGRKLVEHALKTKPCVLLFDGFDEVLSNQISIAKQILQVAATLSQARIFVATRRHFQDELENNLEVIGYTIQPFEEPNQIGFLLRFWVMKGATLNESLERFSEICVKQLSSNISYSERNIAGIPLQCRLLAETYEEDAIRCSKVGYHLYEGSSSNSIALINSIFGMYEKHMNMRFEKISKQESALTRLLSKFTKSNQPDYKVIKQVHMYYALELLFSDHANQFKNLNTSSIPLNELCGLGLLEATHSSDIRFVHRTFAEFLVAWFVHENHNTSSVQEFILSTIFKTNSFDHKFRVPILGLLDINICLNCFHFTLPVICYFINGFAMSDDRFIFTSNNHYPERLLPIYLASAFHNYDHIPYTFSKYLSCSNNTQLAKISDIDEKSMSNLLLIGSMYSSVKLMKLFCSNIDIASMHFLTLKAMDEVDSFMLTPLHMAIMRGNYNLVEYLIKQFENKLSELRYLVHFCVVNSLFNNNYIIEEKINIVKLLKEKNKKCIDERLLDQGTPIMQGRVNSELLVCLIQVGADINIRDLSWNSMLHIFSKNQEIEPKSFHEIIDMLSEKGFKYFNTGNQLKITPLHSAVSTIELLRETLHLFILNGSDLNAVDGRSNSVLFYAIQFWRSMEFIKQLIHLGAQWKHWNEKRQNVLHICAKYGNPNALKYFVETYNMDVNVQDINLNTPLHLAVGAIQTEKHKLVQKYLINNGAIVNVENERRKIPFIEAFEVGKGLSVDVIMQMEKNGLHITPALASETLKAIFHHKYCIPSRLPSEVLQYLIKKGGHLNSELIRNLGKFEVTQYPTPHFVKKTNVIFQLLSEVNEHGLLTDQNNVNLENLNEQLKSKPVYDIDSEISDCFVRACMILQDRCDHEQTGVFKYLHTCLSNTRNNLYSKMFLIPHPRLQEYERTQSVTARIVVLVTESTTLSVRKIQDTIDENVTVLEKSDLDKISVTNQAKLVILKCEVATNELVNNVIGLKYIRSKVIIICSHLNSPIPSEKCEIIMESYTWDEIASHCKDKLWFKLHDTVYPAAELFATPKIIEVMDKHNMDCSKMEAHEYDVFQIIAYKMRHSISKSDDDIHLSLSNKLFRYFFPDKFVFTNITEKNLKEFAKYGQKIVLFDPIMDYSSSDWNYDYIIVEHKHQFEQVLQQVRVNVHLVDYKDGFFKLVQTRGSDVNIRIFIKDKSICESYPFCSCEVADDIKVQFSIVNNDKISGIRGQLKCEISMEELLPEARKIFGFQCDIDLREFRKCFQYVQQQTNQLNQSCNDMQLQTLKLESNPSVAEFAKMINNFFNTIFTCPGDVSNEMKQVAVNTLFPQLTGNLEMNGLEMYVHMKLLSYTSKSLIFIHKALACYLIAEIIVKQKPEYMAAIFNNLAAEVFQNLIIEEHSDQIQLTWWKSSKYCMKKKIHTFKFIKTWLFKFIDFFASKYNCVSFIDLIAKNISTESMFKWIHACINDNLFYLLKLLIGLDRNEHMFQSSDLLVLAVRHSDVSVIELVLQKYNNPTYSCVKDIQLELLNNTTDTSMIISILEVAAMRGDYSVVEYLVKNHYEEEGLMTQLPAVLRASVLDTNMNDFNQLQNRKHIEATDAESNNILHLCSEYLTPPQYAQLVKMLHERNKTKIFHSRNKFQQHPFHTTVHNLELLDSTIYRFSSTEVDFNAANQWNDTVLIDAVKSHRSARLLDSLIKAGANPHKLGNYDRNVLHAAVQADNLTALRYFISLGNDVNARDEDGQTSLHLAVRHSVQLATYTTYEIVKALVYNGADVKARNKFNNSIIDLARQRRDWSYEDITVTFLIKNGASF
ncbi:unnamed protein product [Orchesella dallaii]|uniref:ATPase AAA-type core domain-containing protein n=1 Tax=Orchesella dallaii TaxID=48710 RepID=A0ABP1RQ67_9HEXA